MKKSFFITMFAVITLFIAGCGSSNDNGSNNPPAAEVRVDWIGTWHLTTTLGNSTCEGLTSEITETIEPLDGDMNMQGTITIEGTMFAEGSDGSCELEYFQETDQSLSGRPSKQTKDEFYTSEWNGFPNQEDITRFDVTNYTEQSVSIEIEYVEGPILYQTYDRV